MVLLFTPLTLPFPLFLSSPPAALSFSTTSSLHSFPCILPSIPLFLLSLPFPPLPRSQLVLSESLARQSPRSPYRRAPSAFVPYSAGAEPLPAAHLSFEEETIDDVLKEAKQDIAKMNKHLHRQRVRLYFCNSLQCVSVCVTECTYVRMYICFFAIATLLVIFITLSVVLCSIFYFLKL